VITWFFGMYAGTPGGSLPPLLTAINAARDAASVGSAAGAAINRVVNCSSGTTTTVRPPVFFSSNDVRLGSVLRVSSTPSVSAAGGSGWVDCAQPVAGLSTPGVCDSTIGGGADAGAPDPSAAEQPATASNTTQGRNARTRTATKYPLQLRAQVPTRSARCLSGLRVLSDPGLSLWS
jgi:hypothetical protein